MDSLPDSVLMNIHDNLGFEERKLLTQVSKTQRRVVGTDNQISVYPYELLPGDHIVVCGNPILRIETIEHIEYDHELTFIVNFVEGGSVPLNCDKTIQKIKEC